MLYNIYELETMELENPRAVLFAREQWRFGRPLTKYATNVIHYKFCELCRGSYMSVFKDLHRELWLDLGHTMVGKASLRLNSRMMDVDKAPFYVSIATKERVISANSRASRGEQGILKIHKPKLFPHKILENRLKIQWSCPWFLFRINLPACWNWVNSGFITRLLNATFSLVTRFSFNSQLYRIKL